MSIFPSSFFFSFILLIQTSLSGQVSGNSDIRFRTLAMESGLEGELYFKNGSNFKLLPLPNSRPSESGVADRDSNGSLLLFKELQNDEGEIEYIPDVSVSIPKGSRQVLILAAKQNDKINAIAVNDNLNANERDWLMINVTDVPLALQLGHGEKPVPIPPGQSVFYEAKVKTGSGAAVKVAAYKEEGWKRVYSTFWPIYEGQRGLIICIQDGDSIRVKYISEKVSS